MSARKNRNRRRQLDASHQKNWLIGRYAVTEMLRAGRWPPEEIFAADHLPTELHNELLLLSDRAGLVLHHVSNDRLTELCHSQHHQGLIARMGPYPYADPDTLGHLVRSLPTSHTLTAGRSLPPLVVVCDRLQDSFNFGAILRCCDAMAVNAVIIGETEQAGVTPQVARSSAGAVNHVPVIRAANLCATVQDIRSQGFRVLAASEKSPTDVWNSEIAGPTALIIGSEAHGVAAELLTCCDLVVSIPMLGRVGSLNAAVAAGILLSEIRRRTFDVPGRT
ncbi:MAG: 23S rRNA (guanosine(2251)-2'-O)-methyltransferase RlmB [Planctomycetaceae bacterium]|nr:23S rRNA (guanosine(2251)-2'-O)-methyltransferase RlmB [Planctomycetaceae bacterium]